MELIFKFLNYTIGSLVQIYKNRAQFEENKQILSDNIEDLFQSNDIKENQIEQQILLTYEQQLQQEQLKKNILAIVAVIIIIVVAFLIASRVRK